MSWWLCWWPSVLRRGLTCMPPWPRWGLLAHAGVLPLPSGLHLLANWWVIGASATLFAVEFFADKVNDFAVGHSSQVFSLIKDWVGKKIRRHLMRRQKRKGLG